MKRWGIALMAALGIGTAGVAAAAPERAQSLRPAREQVAIFAGGCFWCMETAYEGRPGVRAVISGYTGGAESNPTYEQVVAHQTGHREAVEVYFDPAVISYAKLVDIFWHSIDPTQNDGQFCDRGESYRSALYWRGEAQREIAVKSKRDLEASGVLKKPIVTEVVRAGKFWPAEEYHQDFWKKSPLRYKSYRFGCGRDQRLAQIWGKAAEKPSAH